MGFQTVNHGFKVTGTLLDNNSNSSVDLTGMILDVMVRKLYIEEVFPLFVIDFKTTEAIRNQMRDNDVSVALKISYYNVDDVNTEENIDNEELVELGVIFDGIIRIYDKPYSTTTSKKEEDIDDAESQSDAAPFVFYRMSGIPEDLISKNEKNMNAVYKNCELIDVVIHMLTSVDTHSQMFIEESINKTKYNDILIPPVSLVPAIDYLDGMYYNIYKHDVNLFLDMNATYLYDPISDMSPKTNIIECNILSPEATGDLENVQRPAVDENNNIKLSYRNVPTFTKNKDIMNHALGSHTTFYNYDENFNITSKAETTETYEKIRYMWQKLSVSSHEMLKKSESMAISLAHINPELINPLTTFRVVTSEYPGTAGDYTVISTSYILNSTDLKHFKSRSVITVLKK